MAGMILTAGLFLNKRTHPRNRPQSRSIPVRFGSFEQRRFDLLLLNRRQSGQSPGPARLEQSGFAFGLGGPVPAADGLAMNSNPARHFGLRPARLEQFESLETPLFQRFEVPFNTSRISHAPTLP